MQDVEWDPARDPGKLTLLYGAGPLADDMRPLGSRRTEIFLNARASEAAGNGGSDDGPGGVEAFSFCCAESSRIVNLGAASAVVSDTETVTEFARLDDDSLSAVCRIAVYLTPNPNSREGVLWSQVGGKAVAFFDYDLDMRRISPPSIGGQADAPQ